MIAGKVKSEKEYREIENDSSSSLKVFLEDRKKYYKIYVAKEKVKDEDDQTKATIMGSLVDCLIFEKDQFDNKFHLSSLSKAPTGKMLDFCNALVRIRREAIENGIEKSFEEIAKEARVAADFSWKLETILSNFSGKDPEIYFNELITVEDKGLTVVDLNDVSNAEKIVEELLTNEVTSWILNLKTNDRYIIFNQYKLEYFQVDELDMKAMMDKIVIDRKNKTIQIYDLKCVWNVEDFYESYYLYRKSYIQAYVYKEAAYELRDLLELDGYTVENPKFIVSDSINYYKPLIYTLDNRDIQDAYSGFSHKGKKYTGVKDVILDLKWAKENNEWRISRKNALNGGVVNIKS